MIGSLKAIALLILPAALAHIPQIPGFTLTWCDDFKGHRNSAPDPRNWIIDIGTSYPGGPPAWGTWEIQTYTNRRENIRVDGKGRLQITALKSENGNWTSSRIETKRSDFAAKPNGKMRIEGRLKTPDLGASGVGYWPAFWTLGTEFRGNYWNWPAVGEIDIMENPNIFDRVWGVLHCGTNPGGVCNEPNGLGNSRPCPNSACNGNFHTYGIEVDRSNTPETIKWFIDGVKYHEVNETQLGKSVWKQTAHRPHFILLNMAMGGGFPDGVYGGKTPIDSTKSGGTYEIDHVAVYNSKKHA